MPSLPSTSKTFVIAARCYIEAAIKVFCSRPVLLDFFVLLQNIFPGFQLCFFCHHDLTASANVLWSSFCNLPPNQHVVFHHMWRLQLLPLLVLSLSSTSVFHTQTFPSTLENLLHSQL